MYAIEAVQNASRRYMAGDLGGKLYHVFSVIVEVNRWDEKAGLHCAEVDTGIPTLYHSVNGQLIHSRPAGQLEDGNCSCCFAFLGFAMKNCGRDDRFLVSLKNSDSNPSWRSCIGR